MDDNLGGIDEELTKYWIKEFKEQTGIIIKKDSKPYKRLKKKCEDFRKDLNFLYLLTIDKDALTKSKDLNIIISRI